LSNVRSDGNLARKRELRAALALAVVPLGVSLLLGMLVLPRRAMPDALPLPIADPQSLRHALELDAELATSARASPLPGAVRALGSALRDFHTLEVTGGQEAQLAKARQAIDKALVDAQAAGDQRLLELRAVQLEAFRAEVARFVSTGLESPELGALSGSFVRSMRSEGWCEGHRLELTAPELGALFKQMWNTLLGVDERQPFELSLDERRTLYALRLAHPRLSARAREAIGAAKRAAKGERECKTIEQSERKAVERWSLDHIRRLAALDPEYPAAYARGVAHLRGGSFGEASDAFREWLSAHPDGPLALRARSYLRWASRAAQVE
jgi:TolA-binding protein